MSQSGGGERKARAVHYPKDPIPDDRLDELIKLFSPPGRKAAGERRAEIWSLVCDLKGWAQNTKSDWAPLFIHGITERLMDITHEAIGDDDAETLQEIWRAWSTSEVKYSEPTKTTEKPVDLWVARDNAKAIKESQITGDKIAALLSGEQRNAPNSPAKISFLESIQDLQRKLKRAPTQREIESKMGWSKKKVSRFCIDLKLTGLLSGSRRR